MLALASFLHSIPITCVYTGVSPRSPPPLQSFSHVWGISLKKHEKNKYKDQPDVPKIKTIKHSYGCGDIWSSPRFKNLPTCVGPEIQDRTLSIFSDVTSTSSTATRTSPKKMRDKVLFWTVISITWKSSYNSLFFRCAIKLHVTLCFCKAKPPPPAFRRSVHSYLSYTDFPLCYFRRLNGLIALTWPSISEPLVKS